MNVSDVELRDAMDKFVKLAPRGILLAALVHLLGLIVTALAERTRP